MALKNFLISILLHLGVLLPVTADQHVYSIAGEPITLTCPDVKPNANQFTVHWKRNGTLVLKYVKGKPWKVDNKNKYKGTENKDFPLEILPEAEEGIYTCSGSKEERNIHLHILKVTGFPEGPLLQGETIELQLHPHNLEQTTIEWIPPRQNGYNPHLTLMDNHQRLRIENLQVQDDGIWRCSVGGKIIPYQVTVIGFHKALDEEIFAAVNSTVALLYELNFNPENENYKNTVQVHQTQETPGKPALSNGSGPCSPRNISEVQFEDAGWYQCHLRIGRRSLNKTIRLVVIGIYISPSGPFLKEGEMKLCCNISAPAPPGALLYWNVENKSTDIPHCLVIRMEGLRTCSLIVKEKVKIRVNYTVESDMGQSGFPLIYVVLGAGLPLGLLILISACLSIYIAIKRKKQRTERMSQAKQHLLAKRTCQCRRKQSNGYYHT